MVPAELWLPPCFSIPNEVIDENLISLLFTLHLSKEEQFDGTVRKSTLDDLRKKKSLLLADSAICEAVTSKYNPLLNRQQIADKTVADCVEALIGTYLQVCVLFIDLSAMCSCSALRVLTFTVFSADVWTSSSYDFLGMDEGSTIRSIKRPAQ